MDVVPIEPPHIAAPLRGVQPLQDLQPVKKRRKEDRRDRRTIPQGVLFVGAIILLSSDGGEQVFCEVVQLQPLMCVPVR